MNEKDFFTKIAIGTSFLLMASILGYVIGFAYNLIVARWLGPEDFGILSIMRSVLGIGGTIAIFSGVGHASVRHISERLARKENTDPVMSTALILQTVLNGAIALIIFMFSDVIASSIFSTMQASLALKFASLVLLMNSVATAFFSFLQAYQKFNFMAYSNLAERFSRLISTLVFLYLGLEILGAIYGVVVGSSFLLMTSIFFFRKIHPGIKLHFDKRIARTLFLFSVPVFFATTIFAVNNTVDVFFLGKFVGVAAIGLYSVAVAIIILVSSVIGLASSAFFPAFTRLYVTENEDLKKKTLNRMMKYGIYLVMPSSVGIFILAESIINIVFGSAFLGAVSALRILSFAAIFYALFHIPNNFLMAIGRPREMMKASLAAIVINVVLDVILVPVYGLIGAAIAMLTSGIVLTGIGMFYTHKNIKLKLNFIFKALISTIAMVPMLLFIKSQSFNLVFKAILIIIAGMVIYFLVLFLVRGFDSEDKKIFREILKKIKGSVKLINDSQIKRHTFR